ncbi:Receptor-type tyrosine-protein phosphatase S [Schistosoma japonicum]|nr:Receptor-type tyrosine-protein phosphatase S [Schistosoma japonicum]
MSLQTEFEITILTSSLRSSCFDSFESANLLAWLPPVKGYEWGTLVGYRVFYWKHSTPNLVNNITVPANVQDCLLSGLESGVVYYAKVQSVFNYGVADSEIISFTTLNQFNIQLVNRSYSEITIQWNFNQTASMFSISVEMIETLLSLTSAFTKRIFNVAANIVSGVYQYQILNLPASSRFRIIVDAIGSNNTSVGSSFLNVWTSPAPFKNSKNLSFSPLVPMFNGSLLVNVKFPTVTGYEGGPLNGFYLVVERNTSTNRMRRSVLDQTQLGLPNNANIVYYSNVYPPNLIVIGSGEVIDGSNLTNNLSTTKKGYANPPLEPNVTYTIYAIVQSEVDGMSEITRSPPVMFLTSSNSSSIKPASTAIGSNTLPIILGILLALAILALVAFAIYYFCCRKSGQYIFRNPRQSNVTFLEKSYLLPDSYAWWSIPRELGEPRYLIIDPEHGHLSTLVGTWPLNEVLKTYSREYSSIPLGVKFPQSIGNLKVNLSKNRNQTSLPYDHNRVTLNRLNDSAETDYINASYIDGYMRRRGYIAAQSPFDLLTTEDFWLMIFQCNIAQIVMLTNSIEDSTLKCCQYWPEMPSRSSSTILLDSKSTSQYFGNIMVEIMDRIDYAHFTVRCFIVTELSSNISQKVVQYQFHSWMTPDHHYNNLPTGFIHGDIILEINRKIDNLSDSNGVLSRSSHDLFCHTSTYGTMFDRLHFIEFYYRVKTASHPEDGPVLVHCSTDLSRTGLYIAFDSLLQQATHEHVVSVAKFCSTLCKARSNIIHSMQQFSLLYDLLFEVLLAGHCIVDLDVCSTYHMLCHKNAITNRSYLWEQWSVLHLYTPVLDPNKELQVSMNPSNTHKNRYPENIDLLPSERWRVCLHCTTSSSNNNSLQTLNYINAFYLDSASLRDDIILTQTPLASTVDDFWCMVEEEQVSSIIDMEPFSYGVDGAVRYWPLRSDENDSTPLFGDLSSEKPDHVDINADYNGTLPLRCGPWLDFVGGQIQICQLGSLIPIYLNPVLSKSSSNHEIYKRRLLIRRREPVNRSMKHRDYHHFSNEKLKAREVVIFHFTGGWNAKINVPDSRITIVRLLEKVRLERGTGPLVIHCLNGATRSGLLAVCYLLSERMTRDHYVDLFHVIKMVKMRRKAILASPNQLRFIYRFLIQWIKYTLAEPLANWTVRQSSGLNVPSSFTSETLKLVGHLPSNSRIGIFSHCQLPILGADQLNAAMNNNEKLHRMSNRSGHGRTGVGDMLSDDSQSIHTNEDYATVEMPFMSTLYRYFNDEILAYPNFDQYSKGASMLMLGRNNNPYCY